jgi:hypothetical protein
MALPTDKFQNGQPSTIKLARYRVEECMAHENELMQIIESAIRNVEANIRKQNPKGTSFPHAESEVQTIAVEIIKLIQAEGFSIVREHK